MSNKAPYKPDDKTVKQGLSIPESLLKAAKGRAKETHGGNLSRYLQSLIEADMKGAASSQAGGASKTPITDFIATHAPGLDMSGPEWRNGFNQAKVALRLAGSLHAFIDDNLLHESGYEGREGADEATVISSAVHDDYCTTVRQFHALVGLVASSGDPAQFLVPQMQECGMLLGWEVNPQKRETGQIAGEALMLPDGIATRKADRDAISKALALHAERTTELGIQNAPKPSKK